MKLTEIEEENRKIDNNKMPPLKSIYPGTEYALLGAIGIQLKQDYIAYLVKGDGATFKNAILKGKRLEKEIDALMGFEAERFRRTCQKEAESCVEVGQLLGRKSFKVSYSRMAIKCAKKIKELLKKGYAEDSEPIKELRKLSEYPSYKKLPNELDSL